MIDDDKISYESLNEFIKLDNQNNVNKVVSDIEERGELYLKEIRVKRDKLEVVKLNMIDFIIENSNSYDFDELKSYSIDDIRIIYNEVKVSKRSFFSKLFHYLFNIN